MSNLDEILRSGLDKLDELKIQAESKLEDINIEKERYLESNKEILEATGPLDEIEEVEASLPIENIEYIEKIGKLIEELSYDVGKIEIIEDFDENKDEMKFLFTCVSIIHDINTEELINRINDATKLCERKYTISADDIEKEKLKLIRVKQIAGIAFATGSYMLNKTPNYANVRTKKDFMRNPNKSIITREIKDIIKSIKPFYIRTMNFLDKSLNELDVSSDLDSIIEEEQNQLEKRKEEIKLREEEFDKKIILAKKNIDEIGKIYELYDQYTQTNDENILNSLLVKLVGLKLISQRDIKKLTYEKEEKIVESDPAIIEPIIEEKKEELPKQEHSLVSPLYFNNPNAQNIICFLGSDNDNIFTDLIDHFDNSSRPYVLSELVSLFNVLYLNRDYENKTGGNPKCFSSAKVKAYRDKLGFSYKRFGVGNAQYRIHAVTRDSELLRQLGYGTGRLTFFGALGVNDDKEKTGAYDRIARRGIASLVNGNRLILQPNFDYIEHITRKYIPLDLLSDADKESNHYGMFNGNIKGTNTKKAIDNFKYMYYDILDSESKDNVKRWLDDYFIKQSEKLFEILNEYNNRKKKNLG